MSMREIANEYNEDIYEVKEWCDELYNEYFAIYFEKERELYVKLKDSQTPISDSDLEWILTTLPLELFDVAERLSTFKLNQEVIKLKIRRKELDMIQDLSTEVKSETKRKEVASVAVLEDKLITTAYSSIISRVESEISFTKELIMGAKKVWDARKSSSSPVGPVVLEETLPEYTPTYIK